MKGGKSDHERNQRGQICVSYSLLVPAWVRIVDRIRATTLDLT
jgi:hypothetical protein